MEIEATAIMPDEPYLPSPPVPPRMSITAGEGGLGVMYGALAKAQSNFKPVKADTTVEVQTREAGKYKFSYAPLENVLAACVPALNAEGFFFSQPLYSSSDGEGYVLRTCLMHASGGMIEVQTYIPKPAGRIQDLGSAITYQRRYVAQALFGVNSEDDDDGAVASGDKTTKVPPKAPTPSAAPPRQNGSPAAAPKAQTTIPATSAVDPAPPAAATASVEPANDGTVVDRELTAEQRTDIGKLFRQLVPKVSAPMMNKIAEEVCGKPADAMKFEDGEKLKANLRDRVAKQGKGAQAS